MPSRSEMSLTPASAICFAILFFIVISLFFRRRRRGVPMLPWQGNTVPLGTHYPNPNQSAYPAMNHQPSWGPGAGAYQPPPGPPPPAEPMPPPPYIAKPPAYDGEENSGYGNPQSPTQQSQEAPQPGGFVVPQSPHSPAAAHVNSSVSPRLCVKFCVLLTRPCFLAPFPVVQILVKRLSSRCVSVSTRPVYCTCYYPPAIAV